VLDELVNNAAFLAEACREVAPGGRLPVVAGLLPDRTRPETIDRSLLFRFTWSSRRDISLASQNWIVRSISHLLGRSGKPNLHLVERCNGSRTNEKVKLWYLKSNSYNCNYVPQCNFINTVIPLFQNSSWFSNELFLK